MRKASRAQPGALPKSLMRRLDLLHVGILPVSRPKPQSAASSLSVKAKKQRIGACFGLGLAGGGVLGCAALLVLLLHAEHGRMHDAVALVEGAAAPAVPEVPATVVSDASAVVAVVVPEPAVAAVEPASPAAPPSLALGAPFQTEVIAAPGPPPAEDGVKAAWPPAEVRAAASEAGKPPVAAEADRDPPPHRPAGLSALGGPQEGETAPTGQLGRKVWWKMPAAPWTPFADRSGPN
jgi:hypothetical protein